MGVVWCIPSKNDVVNITTHLPLFNILQVLAVCHTVVVDHDLETNEVVYQASSPDELALVKGVKDAGFELVHRDTTSMTVLNQNTEGMLDYDILAEFPFDSDRKRMSLIVRYSGQVILLCKGADNKMIPLINFDSEGSKQEVEKELIVFALEGLRTLVVG
jgi:phospholipid-transporting ATPase